MSDEYGLSLIIHRREAIRRVTPTTGEIVQELQRLLRAGLTILHKYPPYANISSFASTNPVETAAFISWAKDQDCIQDYLIIQSRWSAESVGFVLKPAQYALSGFEFEHARLKEHELYEPLPVPLNQHGQDDAEKLQMAYLKKQYNFLNTVVQPDGCFGDSLKARQDGHH